MQEFIEKEKALELSKEIEVAALETNLNTNAAIRLVVEQYKKSCSLPTSKRNNDTKTTNYIISDDEDIDNGEVYNIESGQTIKDLI